MPSRLTPEYYGTTGEVMDVTTNAKGETQYE